ncbi:MAG TPA: hypothetical protein VEC16_02090 [Alphaproteobacteria bacterium]|nr:hypothetical protein [Alphaproteobacteria bacterium]
MNNKINYKIILALLVFLVVPFASAQDVNVAVYILNLGKFDVSSGTYTADFYLSLTCETDCATQNFEFMNGRATSTDKIIDTPTEKFYRIQATFNNPVDLKKFPFDKQQMQIIIEDKVKTVEEINYVANIEESGIDSTVAFTGWNLDEWSAEVTEHEYPVYGETYSRYQFNMDISKIFWNSFIKTILPIIFIMLVALSSFVIDPDKMATRVAMISSALVASVMFHVSISNQVPPVGYMTFADKFMLLTYFILLLSFIINITLFDLLEKKKESIVQRVHKYTEYSMLIVVPIIYVLFFWLAYSVG